MAPRYAKLFKGDLEEELLKDCDKKLLSWWRYIGDIFMIWQYGEKEPEKFLKFLNCYHSTVTFTTNYNYSWEEIILDVSVRKKNNQLVTGLYIKPTDMHQYLHASSFGVYHSKKSLPHNQVLWLDKNFFRELVLR